MRTNKTCAVSWLTLTMALKKRCLLVHSKGQHLLYQRLKASTRLDFPLQHDVSRTLDHLVQKNSYLSHSLNAWKRHSHRIIVRSIKNQHVIFPYARLLIYALSSPLLSAVPKTWCSHSLTGNFPSIQCWLFSTFPISGRFVICVTNMKLTVNRLLFLISPLEREKVHGSMETSYKYSD